MIRDIDLEKMNFLSDIYRNIFLLPEESLKEYEVVFSEIYFQDTYSKELMRNIYGK